MFFQRFSIKDKSTGKTFNYYPWIHLCLPTALAIFIIVNLYKWIYNFQLLELLVIPVGLLTLSSWEWIIHRFWMHKLFKPFSFLFKKHRTHHQMFTDVRMEISSYADLYWVLSPYYAILLVFTTIIPMFVILSWISWNIACLFVMTTLSYFIIYEWTHMCYHLPKEHWVRTKLIERLSAHHITHHKPKNMVKYNFNVTFPLFDHIGRTYKK